MRPSLESYKHLSAGKVRELYEVDENHLLIVASDRISAYDWILDTPIRDKGRVLTAMSFWFFSQLDVKNHLDGGPQDPRIPADLVGRAMIAHKLQMLPVECVARGYLTGSGLADYQRTGVVGGNTLPSGLVEASQLPKPIFTPATKADLGEHDENVDFDAVVTLIGGERAEEVRTATLSIYQRAADIARNRGVILADTKCEFGLNRDGELVLADEVLTPDSSRYWPAEGYEAGRVQPSFDKQFVRDWLTSPASGWDRHGTVAPPELPDDVVEATRERYIDAYERITGLSFSQWPGDM